MAARVVAQNLEMPQQVRHLWIPETVVRADGMRKHQQRPSGDTLKSVKLPQFVRGDEWHFIFGLVADCESMMKAVP